MDGVIVVDRDPPRARYVRPRDLAAGDRVVVGLEGIRVQPHFVERDRSEFAFMSSDVSSERVVRIAVERVAAILRPATARWSPSPDRWSSTPAAPARCAD